MSVTSLARFLAAIAIIHASLAITCERGVCANSTSMKYRPMGRTGLLVSELSFGAWITFGAQIGEDTVTDMMRVAYEHGVNFFDNAETYASGMAETLMGRALKRLDWPRHTYVVSTKIFWGWGGSTPNSVGLSRKHIVEGTRAALERLQLDYVDIVFAHRPDPHTPMEETVRAFNWILDQGWAFYWGTSEWSAEQIRHAQAVADRLGLVPPVVEQPQYNMLHRERVEVEYAPLYADSPGLGTTIWSPLASGVLTGKYNQGIPEGSRLALSQYSWLRDALMKGERHGAWDTVLAKLQALGAIAADIGCTQAQLAIAWCLKNPNVSTVILGASRVEQLEENLAALDVVDKLGGEVMARIDEVMRNAPEHPKDWTKR